MERAFSWSDERLLICAVEIDAKFAVPIAPISALSIACKLSELRLLICVEVNAFTWDDDKAFSPAAPIAAS